MAARQTRKTQSALGPKRSQALADFLSQQKAPDPTSALSTAAGVGANVAGAFLKQKGLKAGQAQEQAQSAELAKILSGTVSEGQLPVGGGFGPGAAVSTPATMDSITAALVSSQFPELQQLGAQQKLGSLGRQESLQETLAGESRAEQTQIRKEERADKRAGTSGDLGARKLKLEERKFDQSVKEFDASLTAVGGITDPEKILRAQGNMRKEFTGLSKEFIKQRDSFARLEASAQDPSAAGDLALIFNFMKILDPGSVVRESEFATAQNAPGVPDRIRAQFNRVLEGERFTPESRADFTNRGKVLFDRAVGQHGQRVEQYTQLATKAGLDPETVTIDLGLAEQAAVQEEQPPVPPVDTQGAIDQAAGPAFTPQQETRLQELEAKQQAGTLQ